MVRAVSGEMREVGRGKEVVGPIGGKLDIGGKFEGCDNYGRERNKEETLVALASISVDSSTETDSTGTGLSNIRSMLMTMMMTMNGSGGRDSSLNNVSLPPPPPVLLYQQMVASNLHGDKAKEEEREANVGKSYQ